MKKKKPHPAAEKEIRDVAVPYAMQRALPFARDQEGQIAAFSTSAEFTRMLRAFRRVEGFALYFVQCNRIDLLPALMQLTRDCLPRQTKELHLTHQDEPLDTILSAAETIREGTLLFIHGLEEHLDHKGASTTLRRLNWKRAALAASARPLIFWLHPHFATMLKEGAADLWDWHSGVYEFVLPAPEVPAREELKVRETVQEELGLKPGEWQRRAAWLKELLESYQEETPTGALARGNAASRLGDLYAVHGTSEQALHYYHTAEQAYRRALPDDSTVESRRALGHLLVDLADLQSTRGQTERARQAAEEALELFQQLAAAEPDRADYARDLSVSYNKLGDLLRGLGQGQAARQYYEKDLAIAEKLAAAEPDRADYARDLSVSHERMGDLLLGLGQGQAARQSYEQALAIAEKLAAAEPDRADYARDLSVSYERMGNLLVDLGQGSAARQAYEQALAIREKLAAAEPDRADYARDLSVSYDKLGDLMRGLGQGQAARQSYEQALAIREKLAAAEPHLLERQLDLVVSYYKLGTSDSGDARRDYLQRALAILHKLQQAGTLPPANAGWIDALQQELAR